MYQFKAIAKHYFWKITRDLWENPLMKIYIFNMENWRIHRGFSTFFWYFLIFPVTLSAVNV